MTPAHPALADRPAYLDYNATTPVDPRVAEAIQPYLAEQFGNPSSTHAFGSGAATALARARQQVAALVGGRPDGVVFTASGSEANNLALRGTVLNRRAGRPHVVTQVTEHPAVLATCEALQRLHGIDVTYLPVDEHGLVDPADLAAALTPDTVLVSVMAANNETGTMQPIAELARVAHERGVLFHTDAAQAAGKIRFDVADLDVDLATVVGHKMYAPKGVGALYLRPGLSLEPVIYGGGQERGLRAGTENVALAVGFGVAADLARADLDIGEPRRLADLRDRLQSGLGDRLAGRVALNGHPDRRLPNTVNVSIAGVRGDDLIADVVGVAAATGSACHAGTTDPSAVLLAMGLDRDRALGAIRLSLGRWTTAGDVDQAVERLGEAAERLVRTEAVCSSPGVAQPTPRAGG
jgi:cysteine desulfurase